MGLRIGDDEVMAPRHEGNGAETDAAKDRRRGSITRTVLDNLEEEAVLVGGAGGYTDRRDSNMTIGRRSGRVCDVR